MDEKVNYRAEVWQDGVMVAAVEHINHLTVAREIMHYAYQYAQDGPVTVKLPKMDAKVVKAIGLKS